PAPPRPRAAGLPAPPVSDAPPPERGAPPPPRPPPAPPRPPAAHAGEQQREADDQASARRHRPIALTGPAGPCVVGAAGVNKVTFHATPPPRACAPWRRTTDG